MRGRMNVVTVFLTVILITRRCLSDSAGQLLGYNELVLLKIPRQETTSSNMTLNNCLDICGLQSYAYAAFVDDLCMCSADMATNINLDNCNESKSCKNSQEDECTPCNLTIAYYLVFDYNEYYSVKFDVGDVVYGDSFTPYTFQLIGSNGECLEDVIGRNLTNTVLFRNSTVEIVTQCREVGDIERIRIGSVVPGNALYLNQVTVQRNDENVIVFPYAGWIDRETYFNVTFGINCTRIELFQMRPSFTKDQHQKRKRSHDFDPQPTQNNMDKMSNKTDTTASFSCLDYATARNMSMKKAFEYGITYSVENGKGVSFDGIFFNKYIPLFNCSMAIVTACTDFPRLSTYMTNDLANKSLAVGGTVTYQCSRGAFNFKGNITRSIVFDCKKDGLLRPFVQKPLACKPSKCRSLSHYKCKINDNNYIA